MFRPQQFTKLAITRQVFNYKDKIFRPFCIALPKRAESILNIKPRNKISVAYTCSVPVVDITSIRRRMEEHCIVPTIIPYPPKQAATVAFRNVEANLGNILTPRSVKHAPKVYYTGDLSSYYCLVMIDLDAPNRSNPYLSQYIHWLVGNIPGVDVCNGDTVTPYMGAGPPKDTGFHRYVILVYKQYCPLTFKEQNLGNVQGRSGFNIRGFADRYALYTPIAGNFFRAAYDDYVPTLYKKFNIKI